MTACRRAPGTVQHLTAVILPSVSVPVLSEQMTVSAPSVSTAGSCRMIALLAAIAVTPSASVMVTTEGRPSGMSATATPMPAANAARSSKPRAK